MLKVAEALALHAEMQQRIASLRAQHQEGVPLPPSEQEQAMLAEIEEMASVLVTSILVLNRTNVWLRLRLNKR